MQREPIAVIGIGCRFPKSLTPEAFWDLLDRAQDAITEVPPERWDAHELYSPIPRTPGKMITRWGGFLENVDAFDTSFFRIQPSEAARMDPQHRLVLEVAWEALESAGVDPSRLVYSQTGVFIGVSHSDYDRILQSNRAQINGHNGTGSYHCFAANRLSYFLKVRGPSMAIDSACSSSLVATHLACQSLQCGECDLALAGGVNLNLTPEEFIALSFLGVLSPDSRSRTFDSDANGYVRGEGCGILVLKRLQDAVRCGDAIHAVIRGSAVNHNGMSNGITAPNGIAQEEVLRRALQVAGVQPGDVSYVEVMGTATSMGDRIEVGALKSVYLDNRPAGRTCWLGSVKPNIGHLEAASGTASLIKAILALQHREIPPNVHCDNVNTQLGLQGTPFEIPMVSQPWLSNSDRRLAGVSSFGFGGTNAHVILEEAPHPSFEPRAHPLYLLILSAQTKAALRDLVSRYLAFLRTPPAKPLADVCFSANTGRSHFAVRMAVVTATPEQLCEQLESSLSTTATPGVFAGEVERRSPKAPLDFDPGALEQMASAYVQGVAIDWSSYSRACPGRRIQLPTYPFQRQRCRLA
jgi:acyl transferase domain-containing protein